MNRPGQPRHPQRLQQSQASRRGDRGQGKAQWRRAPGSKDSWVVPRTSLHTVTIASLRAAHDTAVTTASVPVVFHALQTLPDIDLADAAVGAERAEAAGVKRQRRSELLLLNAHYLADHDQVISRGVQRMHPTIKAAQRASEVRMTFELVGGTPRESQREFALLMAQHVY